MAALCRERNTSLATAQTGRNTARLDRGNDPPDPGRLPEDRPVTPTEIKTIRTGFTLLAAHPDELAAEFYARLFALDPSLTHLFRSDLKAQGRKLTAALALVVNSLDRLDGILGQIQTLGLRHRDYGVEPAHYAIVGAALIDTLEARLGPAFTDEARTAWATAYGILAEAMLTAPDMRDAA